LDSIRITDDYNIDFGDIDKILNIDVAP